MPPTTTLLTFIKYDSSFSIHRERARAHRSTSKDPLSFTPKCVAFHDWYQMFVFHKLFNFVFIFVEGKAHETSWQFPPAIIYRRIKVYKVYTECPECHQLDIRKETRLSIWLVLLLWRVRDWKVVQKTGRTAPFVSITHNFLNQKGKGKTKDIPTLEKMMMSRFVLFLRVGRHKSLGKGCFVWFCCNRTGRSRRRETENDDNWLHLWNVLLFGPTVHTHTPGVEGRH